MPGSEPKRLVLSEPLLRAQGRLLSRPCALRGQIWSIRLVRGEPLTSLRLKVGGHLTFIGSIVPFKDFLYVSILTEKS